MLIFILRAIHVKRTYGWIDKPYDYRKALRLKLADFPSAIAYRVLIFHLPTIGRVLFN